MAIYRWAKHCETCFAFKGARAPSGNYFLRHVLNDEEAAANLDRIRIATIITTTSR